MNVLYASPWVPAEWIEAHGLQPRGIWWAEEFQLHSTPLSAGVCAFSEALVRFAETHAEDAIVFATTCDQLRRAFDALSATAKARSFLFNLPAVWQSAGARRLFETEVERLGRFLETLGG